MIGSQNWTSCYHWIDSRQMNYRSTTNTPEKNRRKPCWHSLSRSWLPNLDRRKAEVPVEVEGNCPRYRHKVGVGAAAKGRNLQSWRRCCHNPVEEVQGTARSCQSRHKVVEFAAESRDRIRLNCFLRRAAAAVDSVHIRHYCRHTAGVEWAGADKRLQTNPLRRTRRLDDCWCRRNRYYHYRPRNWPTIRRDPIAPRLSSNCCCSRPGC